MRDVIPQRGQTVLVTGAAGFLGRALSERLATQDVRVVGLDLAPAVDAASEWIRASSGQCTKFAEQLRKCNAVVHLAWGSNPGSAQASVVNDLSSNVVDAVRLFEAASAAGVEHFVFVSSGGTVYGRPDQHPTPELAELRPIGAYGAAKAAAEVYLRALSHDGPTKLSILRLANPYGPGQLPWRGQGAIPTAVASAMTGRAFTIWGDGSVVRDYLYIDDVVDVLVRVLAQRTPGVMNVGSGVGLTLVDVVNAVEAALSRRVAVEYAAARRIDIPVSVLDVTRLRTELGWSHAVGLREGILRTASWLEANPALWRPSDPRLAQG